MDLLQVLYLLLTHILCPRIVTINQLHHALRLREARISLLLVLILPNEHRCLLSRRPKNHVIVVADLAVERLDTMAKSVTLQLDRCARPELAEQLAIGLG